MIPVAHQQEKAPAHVDIEDRNISSSRIPCGTSGNLCRVSSGRQQAYCAGVVWIDVMDIPVATLVSAAARAEGGLVEVVDAPAFRVVHLVGLARPAAKERPAALAKRVLDEVLLGHAVVNDALSPPFGGFRLQPVLARNWLPAAQRSTPFERTAFHGSRSRPVRKTFSGGSSHHCSVVRPMVAISIGAQPPSMCVVRTTGARFCRMRSMHQV